MTKKKKDHTPLALKVIRWGFPKVERIAPSLAHNYAFNLFFTPFRFTVPQREKEFLVTGEKFTVSVKGKKVQAYSWGNGPVVLLVHGWAGRAGQFRKFIPKLVANNYRAVAFDGPAHGNSEGRKTNVPEFEEVFHKIMEQVGTPVAVIGHSFGGVASIYSIRNGLPISKLINIASPTIGEDIIKGFVKTINASPATGVAFKAHVQKTFHTSFEDISAINLIKFLPHELKLLLVHDEDDKEVPINHPILLQKVYPSAQLLKTSGLGHSRILKDDAVIQKCLEFIQG
ncbi:MAG: alpha/beta fold hydrolase [Bacteroidia bacterium]|nr:alpha/beta fold hydrolase [Bacteroidia bacterium]